MNVNQHLIDNTWPEFRPLLGKRVQLLDKDGKKRVGIMQFAGVNDLLHGQFQVTISKCPIWPVDPKTLQLWKQD
jgi:hypothetical protein